jgi:hypothetical protein
MRRDHDRRRARCGRRLRRAQLRSVAFFFSAPFLFRHEFIRTESSSQPPHPDADIILKTHLTPVRGITRKYAQLR